MGRILKGCLGRHSRRRIVGDKGGGREPCEEGSTEHRARDDGDQDQGGPVAESGEWSGAHLEAGSDRTCR